MKWSSAILALTLVSGRAHAGACCTGSTSAMPTRLGECETWLAGLGITGEQVIGQWQRDGQLAETAMVEQGLESTLAAGWRWDRAGQLAVSLPLRATHRGAGLIDDLGGGVGDLRASVTWDPREERPLGWTPVPVLSAGVRLPTGRSWTDAESALQADVTGLPGSSLTGGLVLERTLGRIPWGLGLSGELPLQEEVPRSVVGAASVGHYLGTHWTVTGGLSHQRTSAQTAATSISARLIRGQVLRWRAWLGGEVHLPVAGLGQGELRQARIVAGAAIVR